MTNRASTLVLLAFATISTGCGGDRAVGPLIDPPVLTSVELSPASVVLFPGFSQQLALAAFDQRRGHLDAPSHAVTYSSSDPAVATVSNSGQITALSAGTAEIAATLTVNGATQKGVMTTTVRNPPVLTSVELSPASVVLFPGFSQQLALAAFDQRRSNLPAPADAVTYSSSDPAVATVSNSGKITALSAGTAEIAATLTVNGATQKGVMTTTVRNYPEGTVSYQLTAPITSFDPGWGDDLTGYSYTVVLQILPDPSSGSGAPLPGTYTKLRLLRPDGEPDLGYAERSGWITSRFDRGRVVFQLLGSNGSGCEWIGVLSSAEPGGFEGTFGAACHISGTFTAKRIGN